MTAPTLFINFSLENIIKIYGFNENKQFITDNLIFYSTKSNMVNLKSDYISIDIEFNPEYSTKIQLLKLKTDYNFNIYDFSKASGYEIKFNKLQPVSAATPDRVLDNVKFGVINEFTASAVTQNPGSRTSQPFYIGFSATNEGGMTTSYYWDPTIVVGGGSTPPNI